jgi:hypothetical protein
MKSRNLESRKQKADGRGQRSEVRRQMTDDRGRRQRTEDRELTTEAE